MEEDEEPAPEALSTGATTAQDSAILDDFINGASLQVTERNGDSLSVCQIGKCLNGFQLIACGSSEGFASLLPSSPL